MGCVVVAASPLPGHVMPMALIGAHLQQCGHEVLLLSGADHRGSAQRAGVRFQPLLGAPNDHRVPQADPLINRLLPGLIQRYLRGRTEMISLFVAPLVSQFAALDAVLSTRRVDAIVADVAFTGVLPLLLRNRHRPAVLVCGVGPLTLSSRDVPPFGVAWPPRRVLRYRAMNGITQRWLLRGVQNRLDDALRSVGARRAPVALVDWPRLADKMLQLTVAGFEYPRRDLPGNVQFVGPVLPTAATDFDPPGWWNLLCGARPVVLVTQGTLDNGDLSQLVEPTVRALADAYVVVVVAIGRNGGRTLQVTAPNAIVAEWVPFESVMPLVDVLVTNGGYGGVQQALRHGVPVIVAGETSDKAEVAARVAYSGVGVNLGCARPRRSAIAAAIRHVLDDGRYRAAARRLAQEMAHNDAFDAIAWVVADVAATADGEPGGAMPDTREAF